MNAKRISPCINFKPLIIDGFQLIFIFQKKPKRLDGIIELFNIRRCSKTWSKAKSDYVYRTYKI